MGRSDFVPSTSFIPWPPGQGIKVLPVNMVFVKGATGSLMKPTKGISDMMGDEI